MLHTSHYSGVQKSSKRVMESELLENTTAQLLLPTQDIPMSALTKHSVAMLVKGPRSTYSIANTFPPHIHFWPLLEIEPA